MHDCLEMNLPPRIVTLVSLAVKACDAELQSQLIARGLVANKELRGVINVNSAVVATTVLRMIAECQNAPGILNELAQDTAREAPEFVMCFRPIANSL